MSLASRDIDRAWHKLGMEVRETNDRHALFYVDGKLVIRTKRSLGSGKISGNIPHFIRQQMKLTQSQFQDLIDCPLGRAEYIAILREKGYV